jgi:hypothetical protein
MRSIVTRGVNHTRRELLVKMAVLLDRRERCGSEDWL